jgi:enterobactin synthetase component F
MRRHQRYDAEQIVRDSGCGGDEALFGPVLNVKVFDYQLDIDGVEAITHTLATGPVNDLELALFPDEQGGLSIEILANKQRYDEATLTRHVARLNAMLVQFAANPDLRCGEVETVSEQEYAAACAHQRYRAGAAVHHAGGSGGGTGEQNAGCPGAGGCAH